MDENITLSVTLSRANAARLLEILNRRVGTLRDEKNSDDSEAMAETKQEQDAIIVVSSALEAAMKARRRAGALAAKPMLDPPNLPSLEAAEEEARHALAKATESLAQAHAVFAAAASTRRETESSAASTAVGVEELKLQRAQAAHENAAERLIEAKGQDGEARRTAAYATSQRTHDDAVAALRQYEPLALEMLKLFSVLAMHADLALADVEAAEKARIDPHKANAVRHLESALEEQKQSHAEAATRHVAEALHQLKLAAE